MKKDRFHMAALIISYVIFGSVGIFVRYIPLSSSVIAALRGLLGALFIFICKLIFKKPLDRAGIKKNALLLLISGGAIGLNWIFLFESYRYTSISTATLCYYMAPVFVTLAAPVILKESFSARGGLGVALALIGMVFASGALLDGGAAPQGVGFGLSAAVLYATAIICNRKMNAIESTDRAMLQLFVAGLVVSPYAAVFGLQNIRLTPQALLLLLTVCLVHTGLAYVLNLGAVGGMEAQRVAVLSFIDPITAIIAAAVIFGEIPDVFGFIGIILVLGGAFIGETQKR